MNSWRRFVVICPVAVRRLTAVAHSSGVSFVSQAGFHCSIGEKLGLAKRLVAVRNTRAIRKKDLVLNNYLPKVTIDSQTRQVRADGELLHCEPVVELPLPQRN